MVFIHGGGYILGSSATPIYDGAALARRGCVYVSVNYRLGALGCLDLSSLSTPQITLDSNVYLRDLVLALRWVHDNIAEFGGDPGNVTIFGESAGAHITATLLAVPAAKGLFARAISESPAAGMVRSREVAAEFAARFANLIGARTQDAANALMQASPAQLVEAQHHLIRQGMRKRLGAFPIGPVFGDDYLPMDPVEAMRSGRVHAVPLIVGTNAEEGRLFTRFLGMLPTNEPMGGWVDFDGIHLQVGSARADPGPFVYGNGPELANGDTLSIGDYRCRSYQAGLFCVNYAHQSAVRFASAGIEPFGCLKPAPPPDGVGVAFGC